MSYRTDRQRVHGLGVSGDGTHHWWSQRLTSIALVPLTLCFIFPFVRALGSDWETVRALYATPFNAFIAILFILVGFRHLQQGIQVVIEDYVHDKPVRTALLLANLFICWAIALTGVFAVAQHRLHCLTGVPPMAAYDVHRPQLRRRGRRRRRLRPARHPRHGRAGPEDRLHHQGLPDPLATPSPHRAASPPRSATWVPTAGSGTSTTPSRAPTGSATPTRWNTSPARRRRRSTSSSTTACPSRAPRTGASTSARSAATPPSSARVRRCSAPAPPPTAPATPSCTRSTASALKHNAQFYIEYFAIDLIMTEDGVCQGVLAWKLDDGTLHRFNAKMMVLATGGYGRAYFSATCGPHLHRRRRRHGRPPGPAAAGHGVRAVPPDRHLRRGLPDHRGRARRGRLPDQLRGRALHGALRPHLQGFSPAATWCRAA